MNREAMQREVLVLVFEFILSMTILIGGGILVINNVSPELASTAIGAVLAYWFSRRQQEVSEKREEKRVESATQMVPPETARAIAKEAAKEVADQNGNGGGTDA